MKVDEILSSINRIWQELSIIVVVHTVALLLGIYAHLIPWQGIVQGSRTVATLPELVEFQKSLKGIGLDLVTFALFVALFYVVLFQRLSAGILFIPKIKLSYSQPALWMAGKCFEELRELVHWFKEYTASSALEDLEVTLGLAITQHVKEYGEHYEELVGTGIAAAAIYSKYYAGFLVLAISSLFLLYYEHGYLRGIVMPLGLIVAALISRCAWEAQIERIVTGRLRFVTDCAIVAGLKRKEIASQNAPPREENEQDTNAATEHRTIDLRLAAELVKLPPPYFPYRKLWLIHYVRTALPFARVGCLSLIRNEPFRRWFEILSESEMTRMDRYKLFRFKEKADRDLRLSLDNPVLSSESGFRLNALRRSPFYWVFGLIPGLFVDDRRVYMIAPRVQQDLERGQMVPLRKWLAMTKLRTGSPAAK